MYYYDPFYNGEDDYIETQTHMGQRGFRGDTHLVNDISKAIIGQAHAISYYERLAALAPNEQFRQTVLSIQHDERRHYHWFTSMLRQMNVRQPQIPPGELPTSFREGVRKAIRDELEANAFYQDIASRATERNIEMRFAHAAQDEQRHAAWFQYMLQNL